MAKKLLLLMLLLAALAAAALAVFLVTFDADRYRPRLAAELEKALGKPVALERLSLSWNNGLALRLQGLSITEETPQGPTPLLQVESASALIDVIPLLRRQVQVNTVVLHRPAVHVIRDPQGRINLLGLAAAASPAGASVHPHTKQSSSAERTGTFGVGVNVETLRIEHGTLRWTDQMTQPPTDISLKAVDVTVDHIAPGVPMDLQISGALGGESPNLRLSGTLTPPAPSQGGSLERGRLTVEAVPLQTLLPPAPRGASQLTGNLTSSIDLTLPTLDPLRWAASASGRGSLKLDEAKILNLNLVRVVLEKCSMVPGLMQRLEERLPPEERAKLSTQDTVLAPMEFAARLEQGLMRLQPFEVRTDTFALAGEGTVALDGTVVLQTMLRIDPAFSAAIISSVNELQALANAKGELEVPLLLQGRAPHVAASPDLNYIASRVLVTKAVDALGRFLEKQRGEDTAPPSDQPQGQPQDQPVPAEPLQFLLDAIR
jgi:AsmA protein